MTKACQLEKKKNTGNLPPLVGRDSTKIGNVGLSRPDISSISSKSQRWPLKLMGFVPKKWYHLKRVESSSVSLVNTVDGRNPAPPEMFFQKNGKNWDKLPINR